MTVCFVCVWAPDGQDWQLKITTAEFNQYDSNLGAEAGDLF
jgi:hypothetical protein